MCGIVGLFLKDRQLEPSLGSTAGGHAGHDDGPGPRQCGHRDLRQTEPRAAPRSPFSRRRPRRTDIRSAATCENAGLKSSVKVKSTHARRSDTEQRTRHAAGISGLSHPRPSHHECRRKRRDLQGSRPAQRCGRPLRHQHDAGTHGIGHTRMATESAVTTLGAHPFSTGPDQCLVHNGSLSNHNNLRRELIREGMTFETENDTEVAAAYLSAEMAKGKNLGEALTGALDDLDGFFTFVVGTQVGLRRGPRSDRLQARGDGGDRPVRRLRLRISRARRTCRASNARESGSPSPPPFISGITRRRPETCQLPLSMLGD